MSVNHSIWFLVSQEQVLMTADQFELHGKLVLFTGNREPHSMVRGNISFTKQSLKHLKRIEVIQDDEDDIMEAVKRMSDRYDFVVTR